VTAPASREGAAYGWPRPLWAAIERARPPLRLLDPTVWRSPLRGPWLTAVFGAVLLVSLPVVIATGLLSYAAYEPRLTGNAFPADPGWLRLPHFAWPTSPSWLYRVNQGLHVGLGLALVPVVLAKLWSVIPKLFAWPPARSFAQLIERLTIALLVGSVLFELATGVLNTQYDYVFGFDFYTGHYYGAWIFLAAFLAHVAIKLPVLLRSLRGRSVRGELRTPLAGTRPEPYDPDGLVALDPAAPTISRRGVLALVGGAAGLLTVLTAGQTVSDRLRPTALLSPRGRSYGSGPNDFQVNRTAAAAGVETAAQGPGWSLQLLGPTEVRLSREDLLAMPQHTAELPIACVEGWSTVQTWTGVRLRDLAARAGAVDVQSARVVSLERAGAFSRASLGGQAVREPDAMLALRVNGVDLSLDHGYPARIIVPALPGVHNTKWVSTIEFTS
jgi:DMSO/TMAO reductase YedYZ molybdopterin-dependent catalytic subunit